MIDAQLKLQEEINALQLKEKTESAEISKIANMMNSDAKTLMVFDDPILDYAVEKGVESAASSATDSMIESADEANNLQRVKDLTLKVKMLENKLK